MKILHRWLCLLMILSLVGSAAACGKKTEQVGTTESLSATELEEAEEDDPSDDAPIDADHLVVKGGESETAASTEGAAQTQKASSPAESGVSAGETAPATNSRTESQSQPSGNTSSIADKPAQTTAAPGRTDTSSREENVPPTEPPTEEPANVVSGIVDLSSKTFEGEGISINGDVVTFTGEGTYVMSGSMTGMIEINTAQKIKLKLNGVNIQNPAGPAIMCTDAKRLTITLIEGTVNTLSDGVNTAADGALFSNDTLEIKGAGSLQIQANNAHGIACDDDIIIKNGNIQVNAVKSGLMANDDITISGGQLRVTGGTNGMKSKGTMNITGGTIWTVGGPKEKKSALYSAGALTITGGSVYAIGCGVSVPDGASTQRSLTVHLSPSGEAGAVYIDGGGFPLMDLSTPYAYNTVFVSTPDLYEGMGCTVNASGRDCGTVTVTGMAADTTI